MAHIEFKALELIAYELLIKETTKECAVNEMVTDENLLFHWYLILISLSDTLLWDVVTLWFTVRGFNCSKNAIKLPREKKDFVKN